MLPMPRLGRRGRVLTCKTPDIYSRCHMPYNNRDLKDLVNAYHSAGLSASLNEPRTERKECDSMLQSGERRAALEKAKKAVRLLTSREATLSAAEANRKKIDELKEEAAEVHKKAESYRNKIAELERIVANVEREAWFFQNRIRALEIQFAYR